MVWYPLDEHPNTIITYACTKYIGQLQREAYQLTEVGITEFSVKQKSKYQI